MTRGRLEGDEIARGSILPRKMPQHWTTAVAQPPIPIMRWARNGKHPNAWLMNALGETLNQVGMRRTKEAFGYFGWIGTESNPVGAGGSLARWRWAFHSGPLTHKLSVSVVMMAPSHTGGSVDSYSTVEIRTNPAGALVDSDEFHYGPSPTGSASTALGWPYIKTITKYLDVDPDTDYQGVLIDQNYGRTLSVCVYEVASMTNHNGGFFPQNIPERAPILSTDRQRMMEFARLLWKRGGSQVWNWTVHDSHSSPTITTSLTARNIVDNSTTAVAASSPGVTLDMRYKDRVSQTNGVPCMMWAYAKVATAVTTGTVYLKDSAGNSITSVAFTSTTAGWASASFNMPATLDKYDLQFDSSDNVTQFQLHAVSIYEYEA